MEDKIRKFRKKAEPANEDMSKSNQPGYQSLVAKIQSKISQNNSVIRPRPQNEEENPKKKGEQTGLKSILHNLQSKATQPVYPTKLKQEILTNKDDRAKSNMRSGISRLSGSNQNGATPVRDLSLLKERIHKQSTVERNIKKDLSQKTIKSTKKISGGDKLTNLLEKFKIHQVKPSEPQGKPQEAKEKVELVGLNQRTPVGGDQSSAKYKTGLELLKKKLQGNSKKSSETVPTRPIATAGPQIPAEGKAGLGGKPKVLQSEGLDLSKYKKQVALKKEKRAEDSSTKPVRERGVETGDAKKASRTVVK